ncbi:MAG: glycerate kinase [Ktedonobacterales bacterium]|nr:glycerate kinase [Ktedonobacterales bacterium]
MLPIETSTLRHLPIGQPLARIVQAALAAVAPGPLVRRALPLAEFATKPLRLLAIGKASVPMAHAALDALPDQVHTALIVTKEGEATQEWHPRTTVIAAGHPIANANSLVAGETIARSLATTAADERVLVLLSGGGSALMVLPVPGVTLSDLQQMTHLLLASGAPITAVNTVRKHLDLVKGGGLARLAYPAPIITLILSDVLGNPLDVIASGPTVPDPSTYGDTLAILERYALTERVPAAILTHLVRGTRGGWPETPKPGDAIFSHGYTTVIGDIEVAAKAALLQAQVEGFHTAILTTAMEGEAREVGRFFASIAQEMVHSGQPLPRPACLIIGGETTVTLHGTGRGGRNQEVALAMVEALAGLDRVAVLTLATDGVDGPTDAAGAVVTGTSLQRALELHCPPTDFLVRNDAMTFFDGLGDVLRIGPTSTNVNDLTFIVTW